MYSTKAALEKIYENGLQNSAKLEHAHVHERFMMLAHEAVKAYAHVATDCPEPHTCSARSVAGDGTTDRKVLAGRLTAITHMATRRSMSEAFKFMGVNEPDDSGHSDWTDEKVKQDIQKLVEVGQAIGVLPKGKPTTMFYLMNAPALIDAAIASVQHARQGGTAKGLLHDAGPMDEHKIMARSRHVLRVNTDEMLAAAVNEYKTQHRNFREDHDDAA